MLHDLVQSALLWIESLGYWGIMIGLMIEVIPSEIVLGYGGYLVYQGKVSFWGAVLFGTIGGVIAQIFVYWIGRYGGRPFLEKYGKYILIRKHHIDVAENWFNKYGTGVIFTARFIPVVRHAISVPAGIARMPLSRFTILTTLAVIPWSIFFVWLGHSLGQNWENIEEEGSKYIAWFIGGAVLLLAAYFGYKIWSGRRSKSKAQTGDHTSEGSGSLAPSVGSKHNAQGGQAGQVAALLKGIGGEYKVLSDRRVRGGSGPQPFDHIVVGPNGIFHIDEKNWSGEVRFTRDGVIRSGLENRTEDATAQLYRNEYVIKELLREASAEADIVGIICFTHPDVRLEGSSSAFRSVKLDRLVETIKGHRPKKALDAAAVQKLVGLIEKRSERV